MGDAVVEYDAGEEKDGEACNLKEEAGDDYISACVYYGGVGYGTAI